MGQFRWASGLLLLIFAVACLSCSNEGARDSSRLTGKAGAGNASVWLDLNGNFALDPGEPNSRTTEEGEYALDLPAGESAEEKLILVGIEAGESKTPDGRLAPYSYLLFSPSDHDRVSVWTTLAAAMNAVGAVGLQEAREKVRAAFDLPADFDFASDPADWGRGIEGLTQVAQSAYEQKAADLNSRPEFESMDAALAAAEEVLESSELLLGIADREPLLSPPLLTDPRSMKTGLFHGDFSAIPINTNMAYGKGLDETSYGLKGSCIESQPVPHEGLCSNEYDYTFELVQSVDELRKHLGIGASAKAGVSVAGFDVVSVSGGFKFLRDTEFKDNFLYIVFSERHKICGYPARPVLQTEWEEKFGADYEEFRSACGDRFLSSITSGGAFTALIEVQVDEDTRKEDLRLELSGKVFGATVFDRTWTEALADIDRDYNARTRVISNRFQYSDNYLGIQEVFDRYDEFAAGMRESHCSGPDGWKTCGHTASFAAYETITDRISGRSEGLRTHLANMKALEASYFGNSGVLDQVDEILLFPDDYNMGENVDAFSEPNAWDMDKLQVFRDEVEDYQLIAVGQWDRCKGDIDQCTRSPEDLGLPPWSELMQELPTRKFVFPESCKSLARQYEKVDDGFYWLYLGGDFSRAYRVYCSHMTASEPKTYLELFNTSANTASPTYNYASLYYATDGGSQGIITRTFDALRVEPRTDPVTKKRYLRVLPGQTALTDWAAEPDQDGDAQTLLAQSLGVLEAQGQGGATATANVSLEGTPFSLSPSLSIKGDGASSDPAVKVDDSRKNIDVSVTGGAAAPDGMILLEWAESDPSE